MKIYVRTMHAVSQIASGGYHEIAFRYRLVFSPDLAAEKLDRLFSVKHEEILRSLFGEVEIIQIDRHPLAIHQLPS